MNPSAYREDLPSSPLRAVVVCTWARGAAPPDAGSGSGSDVILPDGCVDIVWDGESVFVAGPDTGPVVLDALAVRRAHAGIRFRPGAAPAFLGVPADEIRDRRVPLDALWGTADARVLTDRLSTAAAPTATLERAVLDHADRPVDPLARMAVQAIARVPSTRVDGLGDRLGVTERTLHRRVRAAVGYGPKVLARIVRFRRFLALASRRGGLSLAELAHAAGYADQAHLARECRARSPTALPPSWSPRAVSDSFKTG